MYPLPVQDVPFNSFSVFRKTVTSSGTPERLTSSSRVCRYFVMQALSSNTDIMTYGFDSDSAKAANGFQVYPGQAFTFPLDDMTKLWIDVAADGEGVCVFFPKNT